jgi:hypothetical protein
MRTKYEIDINTNERRMKRWVGYVACMREIWNKPTLRILIRKTGWK